MKKLIENLLIIFSADNGKLRVLLLKSTGEDGDLYKVPSEILENDSVIDSSKKIFKNLASSDLNIIDTKVFDIISEEKLVICNAIVMSKKFITAKNIAWFELDELPNMREEYKEFVLSVFLEIKKKINCNYSDILLDLFPSTFTLSEFQRFYESMLGKSIDRRNFRKKVLGQKLVIDTGKKTTNGSGRPGTLYLFDKDKMKGKVI